MSKSESVSYNVGTTNTLGTFLDLFNQILNQNMTQQSDYSEQIITLNNMGFYDNEQNQLLLNLYQGNIEQVMNYLLGY